MARWKAAGGDEWADAANGLNSAKTTAASIMGFEKQLKPTQRSWSNVRYGSEADTPAERLLWWKPDIYDVH
jgi:hypothetical protein